MKDTKKLSILIFLIAFLVRLAVQYYMGSFFNPETWEHEGVANNFLLGRGLSYELYGTTYNSLCTPLYPLLCSLVYFITNHSFLIMAIIQALISSLTCVAIFCIARRIFDIKVGLLAAGLTIFHPGILVYVSKFHSFTLDSFLLCIIPLSLIMTKRNPTILNQIKLGISFGLTGLTRSTILLFLPITWLWLRKTAKKTFFIYILISLIVLSPWLIRNYIIYKKFLIISTSAEVFWRGNNPLATGTSLAHSGRPMLEESKDVMSLIYGKKEMGQNRIFWNESFKFIRNNPAKFIRLSLKKLFYFWWFAPTTGSRYKKEWLEVYKILYSVILLFSFLGIIGLKKLGARLKYDAFIIILLMITISVAQSLFYVETRHRWAIEPLMLIFTANGLIYTKEKIRQCLKMKT